jgi:hypothetical protein
MTTLENASSRTATARLTFARWKRNRLCVTVVLRHYSRVLLVLATVLEQLDLALEHILKRDIHNARFGLMLTDSARELVLHQIAKTRSTISSPTKSRLMLRGN